MYHWYPVIYQVIDLPTPRPWYKYIVLVIDEPQDRF